MARDQRLTEKEIEHTLKPRTARYAVSDERGLSIEVFPTGGKLWHVRYRLKGKAERVTLGRWPDLSLKLARQKRDEALTLVALGQSPAAEKRKARLGTERSTTVEAFAKRYLTEVVAKDRKSDAMPRRYLDRDILPALRSKLICEVTTEEVRGVIWRKKEEGFDAAAGQIRGVLSRMFDFAMAQGLTDSNPVLTLPMRHVHKPRSRDRALSPDEIGTFLNAVFRSNMRTQFRVSLHLILLTMVRKSELLLAERRHVDLDAREWLIPAEHSKTGKPHVVYLSNQAITCFHQLFALAGPSHLVLPGRSSGKQPFAHNAINNALKVSLKGEQIAAFTIHDLRRTASTLLHEQGFVSDVVEKALNHTIGGVRGVYNRAEYGAQRREMLQFWANYIDGLIKTDPLAAARMPQLQSQE